MRRELSRREVRLLLVLPALLIAIVYLFGFERPNDAEMRRLARATEVAQQRAVPPLRIETAKRAVLKLEEQVQAEQHRVVADAHPSLKLPQRWTTPTGRLESLATIASVFDAHGLAVVDTSHQADTEARGFVPKALADFANMLVRDNHCPAPEVWRVEAVGSYANVLAALEELGRRDVFIVPLAMTMQTLPEDPAKQRWSLWFWV